MFRKILCPVDITDWKRSQLTYARNFARFQCADIYKIRISKHAFVHQEELPMAELYGYQPFKSDSNIPIQRRKVMIRDPGAAAHEIHKIADEKHFDLIMMPTNLQSDPFSSSDYSIFKEILVSSATPVLGVPDKIRFKLPARILCVIDPHQSPSSLSHFMPLLAAEAHAKYFLMTSLEQTIQTPETRFQTTWEAEQNLIYMMREVSYALGADEIAVRIGHATEENSRTHQTKKDRLYSFGI